MEVETVLSKDLRAAEDRLRLIINAEAQYQFSPGYPLIKRAIYYCARMISSQYGREFTKSHYEKVKKVVSIWVCANPPRERANTITSYGITQRNLVGHVQEKVEHYDLMEAIMICLGRPEDSEEGSILRLLDVLLSRETGHEEKRRVLREEYEIPMSETLDSEVSQMCNLSQGVWEDGHRNGIEQGMREGMEKGMEKGMREGKEKGLLESVRSLMDTMQLTPDQAMAALRISEADRPRYRSLLQ